MLEVSTPRTRTRLKPDPSKAGLDQSRTRSKSDQPRHAGSLTYPKPDLLKARPNRCRTRWKQSKIDLFMKAKFSPHLFCSTKKLQQKERLCEFCVYMSMGGPYNCNIFKKDRQFLATHSTINTAKNAMVFHFNTNFC